MDVMAANDSRESLNVLLDVLHINPVRSGLKQNVCRSHGEGAGRSKNDKSDKQRDRGIRIVLARPVGKPDDQGSDYDAHVTESVSNHMQNHGVHAHVSVVMSVALLARLLWLVVVVLMMYH